MVVGSFCGRLIVRTEVTLVIVNDFGGPEASEPDSRFGTTLRCVCRVPLFCAPPDVYAGRMRRSLSFMLVDLALLTSAALGAAKPHVINFGKTTAIKWCVGVDEGKCLDLKVRALYVDGRARESTLGQSHEITERLFVVRRAFRVNDNLPGDKAAAPGWVWQRGGWLLVDRTTGHISAIALPEFDPYYSVASWYRDYAAYCGVSDDGKKLFAIVFQVTPQLVLKKTLGEAGGDDAPDSECPSPVWERRPVRVTFEQEENHKTTYSVRGHAADLVSDDDGEEEKASQ
jgi:hypothetical protein